MDVDHIVIGSMNAEPTGQIGGVLVFSVEFANEAVNRKSLVDQSSITGQCFAARYYRGDFDLNPFEPVECGTQRADGQTRAALHK